MRECEVKKFDLDKHQKFYTCQENQLVENESNWNQQNLRASFSGGQIFDQLNTDLSRW